MSGFVCLTDRGRGGVTREEVATILERISHRGPDGSGIWVDNRTGLGHQQLQTTPESKHDDQPTRAGDSVVTADARIDNRQELLENLPVPESGAQVTDSQLLLAAYRKWGTDCVERLVGAFAFVIWNTAEKTVFCARDHFGVKPFYYHRSGDVFAAASEMKSLLALPSVPETLDERAVGDFLLGQFDDTEITVYETVQRLAPAHAMSVSEDGIEQWQYWSLDPSRTVTLGSDAAYQRRFRELFEQAIQCRLRRPPDDRVGTALSGGIDSSAIAVVARQLLPAGEPLHTFSNVSEEAPSSDEREFIEHITEREGFIPHYASLDGVGSLVDENKLFQYFDRPPHDSMSFAIWERVKRADQTGVSILLEGALGDSAVGYGLGLLPELLRTGRWIRLYRELAAIAEVADGSPRRLFMRHAVSPLVPDPVRRAYRRLRGESGLERKNPTLSPDFVDRVGLRNRYREINDSSSVLRRTARRWQARSLRSGLLVASLETSDLINAAFGVAPRYPFTDRRLVEFSLAIPPTQQLKDGWTRSIIRRSLSDRLPDAIQWRVWKTPLNEAFWNALAREADGIQRICEDPGQLSDYVDTNALQSAYRRFEEDPTPRDARALWRSLSLSAWLESRNSDS